MNKKRLKELEDKLEQQTSQYVGIERQIEEMMRKTTVKFFEVQEKQKFLKSLELRIEETRKEIELAKRELLVSSTIQAKLLAKGFEQVGNEFIKADCLIIVNDYITIKKSGEMTIVKSSD